MADGEERGSQTVAYPLAVPHLVHGGVSLLDSMRLEKLVGLAVDEIHVIGTSKRGNVGIVKIFGFYNTRFQIEIGICNAKQLTSLQLLTDKEQTTSVYCLISLFHQSEHLQANYKYKISRSYGCSVQESQCLSRILHSRQFYGKLIISK